MLYLITEEQRKRITLNYYTRVMQVITWFVVGVYVMIGILVIPTMILLQTEVKTSEQKISDLEYEIVKAKKENTEEGAKFITNKIEVLKLAYSTEARKKYMEIERVVQSVSGVKITSLTVDTLTKTVQIITTVRDKDSAKALVDVLNTTTYTGATLPYSVLSEKSSFIFAQNLKYE